MPADHADIRPRRTGRVILAAITAWLVYSVARRALRLALLAGVLAAAAGFAQSRGVDLSGVQRIATCEGHALIASAGHQLGHALAPPAGSSHRSAGLSTQLARCQAHSPAATGPRRRPGAGS